MAFHSIAINTPYDCSMTRMEISTTMILTHFPSTNYLLKEMVLKNSLHLKYWSLHILMKNVISKEFALKLLDLQNCFLMENDPIFLFNRIMVISQNPGQINDLTLNSFISGRKCCIHISLSCLLLLLKRILWHVVSLPPSLPASTNWFVNDKIWVLIMKCYIGLAIEHLLWWGALASAGLVTTPVLTSSSWSTLPGLAAAAELGCSPHMQLLPENTSAANVMLSWAVLDGVLLGGEGEPAWQERSHVCSVLAWTGPLVTQLHHSLASWKMNQNWQFPLF